MQSDRLRRLKEKAAHTTKRMLGIALYLWVLLSLFALHKALLLKRDDTLFHVGFSFLNALALAKVIFIGQELRIGDKLREKPLVYPIVFKSAVFAALLFMFRLLEETVVGWRHGRSFYETISLEPALGGGALPGVAIVCVIIFVALLPFFAYLEFQEAIGSDVLRAMLFGTPATRAKSEDMARAEVADKAQGAAVWYFARSETVLGPFTPQEISEMRRKAEIDARTLLYNAERGVEWKALGEIPAEAFDA